VKQLKELLETVKTEVSVRPAIKEAVDDVIRNSSYGAVLEAIAEVMMTDEHHADDRDVIATTREARLAVEEAAKKAWQIDRA